MDLKNGNHIIYNRCLIYNIHEDSEINTGSTCIQIFYKTDEPIHDKTLFRTPLHGSEKWNDKCIKH